MIEVCNTKEGGDDSQADINISWCKYRIKTNTPAFQGSRSYDHDRWSHLGHQRSHRVDWEHHGFFFIPLQPTSSYKIQGIFSILISIPLHKTHCWYYQDTHIWLDLPFLLYIIFISLLVTKKLISLPNSHLLNSFLALLTPIHFTFACTVEELTSWNICISDFRFWRDL